MPRVDILKDTDGMPGRETEQPTEHGTFGTTVLFSHDTVSLLLDADCATSDA